MYVIRDWTTIYESHETRKYKSLSYLYSPNKHSITLKKVVSGHPNGAAHVGVWKLIADLASRVRQPNRDGRIASESGRPYNFEEISLATCVPEPIIREAIERFSQDFDWIEVISVPGESPALPGISPDLPGESPVRTEQNRTEQNRNTVNGKNGKSEAGLRVLAALNSARGPDGHPIAPHAYGPTKGNLREILRCLAAGGVEAEMILVVAHRAKEAARDPAVRRYFNPITIFRDSNYERNLNAALVERAFGGNGGPPEKKPVELDAAANFRVSKMREAGR